MELEGTGTKRVTVYNGQKTEKQTNTDMPEVLDIVMQPRTLYLIEVK